MLFHFLRHLGVFFPLPGEKVPFEKIKVGKAHSFQFFGFLPFKM